MKVLISFVVVSFLGLVFSLDSESRGNEVNFADNLIHAETTECVYEVAYYFELEEGVSNLAFFKSEVVRVINSYRASLESIGYTLVYDSGDWDSDANRQVFHMRWIHSDEAMAELTIRRCIQDIGGYIWDACGEIARMWGAINWGVFELYR